MQNIIQLEPFFSHAPWGGKRLAQWKNCPPDTSIAESWEVSAIPTTSSHANGQALSDFLSFNQLPYLVKLIDTSAELSIQVHPCEKYLQQQKIKAIAKDECWLILQTQKDAGIYLGLRPQVTPEHFTSHFSQKDQVTNVHELLNFIPVNPGDFFFVPAGVIHAIGRNVTLLEIQRPIDSTFRLWDWNRTGPQGQQRALHLSQGLAVLALNWEKNCHLNRALQNNFSTNHDQLVFAHHDFELYTLPLTKDSINLVFRHQHSSRWRTIMSIRGTVILNDQVILTPFTSALIQNTMEALTIAPMENDSRILWVE